MDPFRQQLILDLVRLGLAFGLFFVLLPGLFTGLYARDGGCRNGLASAGFALSGTLYLVLVHVLVVLGVFDPLFYLGAVAGLAAFSLGLKYRGVRAVTAYAGALRFLESDGRRSRLRPRVRSAIDVGGWLRPGFTVACALLLAVVAVRVRPFWQSLNPSSFTFYDVLYEVKSLLVGQAFPGGVLEERGLHAFALTLHTFSQLGVEPVVLLIGLTSVLVLACVVYDVTTAASRSPVAGVTAAALFGIVGAWWQPLGPTVHTQADPLPLATAFLLATLFFAARYVHQGRRPDALVASAALLSCTLVSAPAAAIGGALLGVGPLAYVLFLPRKPSGRALLVSLLGGGVLLGFTVAAWTGPHVLESVDPYLVPRFEVVMNTVAQEGTGAATRTLLGLAALAATALAWMGRTGSAPIPRSTAHLSALAVAVLGGIAWLSTTFGIQGLGARTPVFLLSVFLCIAGGLLVVPVWTEARRRAQGLVDAAGHRTAFVAGCLMIGGSIWPPVPLPLVEHDAIQPRGYAHAYAKARRIAEPGGWTVVGHEGLRIQVKNDGAFMAYDELLRAAHPDSLIRTQGLRSSTRDIFVFVDVRPDESWIRAELSPPGPETIRSVERRLAGWAARTPQVRVFYEDESVRVYRIRNLPESIPGRAELLASHGAER